MTEWQRSGPGPGQDYSNAFITARDDPAVQLADLEEETVSWARELLSGMSEEAQEGRDAFKEKRTPDFARFPRP